MLKKLTLVFSVVAALGIAVAGAAADSNEEREQNHSKSTSVAEGWCTSVSSNTAFIGQQAGKKQSDVNDDGAKKAETEKENKKADTMEFGYRPVVL